MYIKNCTVIRHNDKQRVIKLLHISLLLGLSSRTEDYKGGPTHE